MEKVQNYITENKERFLEELFELLRIPSISAQSEHKPDMVRCAEWLAAALVKAGADHAEVMPTDGNPVVYAEKIIDPKAKATMITKEERFEEYMETKVLPTKYNSYITFNSEMYNYLDTTKCYWLNYEYNEEKAFALSKLSEGIMKIYPENKTKKCSAIPIINVPKEKLFNEIH